MKLFLKLEDAVELHRQFYKDQDFTVVAIQRRGLFDFFPFSMVYGISDIGSWYGVISTDGNKIVVSKNNYYKQDRISKTWEFEKSKIQKVTRGTLSSSILLDEKIKGLTQNSTNSFMKFLLTFVGVTFILPLVGGKIFRFRVEEDFDNEDKLFNLINR